MIAKWAAILFTDCWNNYQQKVSQVSCILFYCHILEAGDIEKPNTRNYKADKLEIQLPDEHVAMTRPSKWGLGFTSLTAIHPSIPPKRKVKPILTGINHLYKHNYEILW